MSLPETQTGLRSVTRNDAPRGSEKHLCYRMFTMPYTQVLVIVELLSS